jgi:phosphoglycolate phosphatase
MSFSSIKNKKAVVFDLDGTLIDTSEGILNSVRETINCFGYSPLGKDDLMSFMAGSIYDTFQRFFPDMESSVMVSDFRKRYSEIHFCEATPYEGIQVLLKQLKDLGFSIGVATFKREDLAERLLSSFPFYHCFDVICGSDADGLLTKIDIIKNCLAGLNIHDNNQVLMIGDAPNDAKSAESIGLPFFGVTYGYGFKTKEDVERYPNVGYTNTVQGIINVLKLK